MPDDLMLRDVRPSDLPVLFDQQNDPDATWMAAFTAKDPGDRDAFDRHWSRILADPSVTVKVIVHGEEVLGSVLSYETDGVPEVSYWISRAEWGKGTATKALSRFLAEANTTRPIRARVAKDNHGSIRVLEKCGFRAIGEARGFANARGEEIDELLFELPSHLSAAPTTP